MVYILPNVSRGQITELSMIVRENSLYLGGLGLIILSVIVYCENLHSFSSDYELFDEKILWEDSFESGELCGWKIVDDLNEESSNWYIEKGFLIQDTDCGDTKRLIGTNIINGNIEWRNYVVHVNLISTDDDYIGILFRYNDKNNYYRFLLSSQRKDIRIDKKVGGTFINLAHYTEEEWQLTKFSVTVFLFNDNIKLYLNNKLFFDINDDEFQKGKVGFVSISNLGSFFDDITIYSEYNIQPPNTTPDFTRGPYLQNVLNNHAVVMWNTSVPLSSVVEYGLTPESTWLVSSDELTRNHEVRLENLLRETRYYYRIKSGDLIGEWNSFNTAVKDNASFSFIAYGDNQMNFLRHAEIVEQISKQDYDFIISCGDVVQRGPRADWDVEFFEPLKEVLNGKCIYAAIGNHELNSENYYKNFCNPDTNHENYYSFTYGNCFFIFLDNPRAAYPDKIYYTDYTSGSDQYKWLEAELSSNEATSSDWLIVISHVPSYVAGSQEFFIGCKENLVPLFEKYGVDLSISGHTHGYERGSVNNVNYIVTAGGGGAQNKKNSLLLKQYKDFNLVYNFCHIDVGSKVITVRVFDNESTILDQFEITK